MEDVVGELWMGQVVRSWFIRDWAQVRARVARSLGVGLGGRGLESVRRRLPRSKVWGMGGLMAVVLEEDVNGFLLEGLGKGLRIVCFCGGGCRRMRFDIHCYGLAFRCMLDGC